MKDEKSIYKSKIEDLKDKNVNCIYRDNTGGMWVGTEFVGVNYWNKARDKFSSLTIPGRHPEIEDEIITCIHCDAQGAVWTATRFDGLDRYFPETNKHVHYALNNVRTIHISEDGRYAYTGTEINGMHSIDLKSGKISALSSPKDVMSIKGAGDGKLWLGTLVGLYLYDPEKNLSSRAYPTSDNSSLVRILNLGKDSKGRLWVGAKEHLLVLETTKDNTITDVTPEVMKGIIQIQCLYETSDSTMWIGSLDGLVSYKEDKNGTGSLEYVNALQNTSIRGVEEDNKGNLWISTNNGLFRYVRKTGEARSYNKDDGLRCELFNACAHNKDTAGNLYFGGTNGVEVFSPEKMTINTDTFQPIITELVVNNAPIKPGDKSGILKSNIQYTDRIKLKYWQNSLTLSFSCADMISGESNTYQYKMEGIDTDWTTARGREATYTKLDKGKYVFLLRASNSDGIWCKTPKRLEITVKAVWYRSTAMRVILAILIFGAMAFTLSWFIKKIETDREKEIQELTKTYEEKVQKTKLEMFVDSSYNLKSNEEAFLSSILSYIEKDIGNPELSVEAIASHACISRGNLHLKIKTLTGKSPVELIKTMRMKRACELMKETNLSVADIAEQTGFQTPGYFIKVFKNHFGETPGHYASRVRQQ